MNKKKSLKKNKPFSAFSRLENEINLKHKLNNVKNHVKKKQKILLNLQDKLNELETENDFSSEGSPYYKSIRILENKLDKIIIKYNEAQSIKKTYQKIVLKLKEERIGYNNQINVIQRTLKSKEADFTGLLLRSNDVVHTKDSAMNELKNMEKQQIIVEKKRGKYIMCKRMKIDQTLEKMKQKERRRQKMIEKEILNKQMKENLKYTLMVKNQVLDMNNINKEIDSYEKNFLELYEITGANDVNEIIQKFLVQEETKKSLDELEKKYLQKINIQENEKIELRKEIENLKTNFDIKDHFKEIEYIDKTLSKSKIRLNNEKYRNEKITDILIRLQSGLEHLYNKMKFINLEEEDINYNKNEPPFLRLIKNLNQKIKLIYEVVKKDSKYAQILSSKKQLFDPNELCVDFVDPNFYDKHIIFGDFNNELQNQDKNGGDKGSGESGDENSETENSSLDK